MTENGARRHLRKMLRSFTGGTVHHLLGEVYRELAAEAHSQEDDGLACRQFRAVASALFVAGLGIDAACPRER